MIENSRQFIIKDLMLDRIESKSTEDEFRWERYTSGTGDPPVFVPAEHLDEIQDRLTELAPDDRQWFTVSGTGNGDGFFVKVFRHDSFLQRFRYTMFGSQAYHEWHHLMQLHAADVPVPDPLLLGQRFSRGLLNACVLVTRNLGGNTLRSVLRETYGSDRWPSLRHKIWNRLADVTAQLFDQGFHHQDYHDQNIVVRPEVDALRNGATPELYVTDLHRGRTSSTIKDRSKLQMMAFLIYSLESVVPLWECRRLYRCLQQKQDRKLPAWHELIPSLVRRRRDHRTNRTADCFSEHDHVNVSKLDDTWNLHHDPEIPVKQISQWIEHVNRIPSRDQTDEFKERSDGRVVHMTDGEVVLKETCGTSLIRKLQRFIGQSRSRNYWRNAYGLQVRNIAHPTSLALIEPRHLFSDKSSYFVQEYLKDAVPVNDYAKQIQKHNPNTVSNDPVRRLISSTTKYVRMLHREGIFHKNLEASNLLVTPENGEYKFYLIDLDRISFYDRPLPPEPRICNLVQISHSLFSTVPRTLLMRAWQLYLNDPSVPFSQPDEVLHSIVGRIQER